MIQPTVMQPDCSGGSTDWPMFGQNVCNTGSPNGASTITKDNAAKLKTKWTFMAAGEISATPAVVAGNVYVPDWGGNISKINAQTGALVWKKSVASLLAGTSSLTGFFSRTTPLVTSDSVIIGTMRAGAPLVTQYGPGAFIVSLDKDSGAVKWITPVHENHPAAIVSASPVYDGTNLYIGVASSEEAFKNYNKSYMCCSFRGAVYAINASTGAVVWKTHTISDSLYYANGTSGTLGGYTGDSIWSSAPVLDRKRHQLYVTTGNNYTLPQGSMGMVNGNAVDAVMAVDVATGAVKWTTSLPEGGVDIWTFDDPMGPDSDFGAGANFFTAMVDGTATDLVGAGQKSGMYYALNADTGSVVWKTQVGPGGHLGGIHWGTATDGVRIYVGVNNEGGGSYTLQGKGPQAGKTTHTGIWSALDPATGAILWQIENPALSLPVQGADVNAPVVAVNGVVLGGSMDAMGTMFAIDGATGDVLWSFKSGGTVYGGPAVVGDTVYWGSGYTSSRLGFGTSSQKLYAFQVP
jgi:polyvinyl alcohol dehydrogenase (cytochrome)